MRALKIIGGIVAAMALVLIAGAIAIVALVDPNDYRDDIGRLVEQETGRELQIGGELDLQLFPWLALQVDSVALGNPPGFGPEPFLTVERASIGVKLIPLLRKRLEVSRVAIQGLSVTLISRDEETNNWKDLGGESDEEAGAQEAPPEITVAGLEVTDSTLVYRDEAEDSVARLLNLQVRTGALGSGDPVHGTVLFDYADAGDRPLAHVNVDTQVWLPRGESRLELRDLELTGQWFPASENGEPADAMPFLVKTPVLALDLESETLAPATFEAKLADLPVGLTAAGERLFGDRVVTGEIKVERVSLRGVLPSLGIEVPATSDPQVLTAFELASGYRLTENDLRLTGLELLLDDTHVKGTAGITDLERMALAFELDVDALNLDRYLEPDPEETESDSSQEQPTEPPTDLPLEALRELDANGTLHIARATVADLDFSNVRLPLAARGGRIRLGPTQARLYGGGYKGDIVLDARGKQARLSLNEHVEGIDIGALVKAMFETDRLAGRGNADAVLTAAGTTDKALFESLAGKIDANVESGALNGVDLWYELRRARALLERETLPEPSGNPRTEFKALAASAVLDDGVVRNDDLAIETDYLKVRGKGTIEVSTQLVDYALVAEVYKIPPQGAGAELASLEAAEIPIQVSGTLEDLKVRPDIEGLIKARVREKVDDKVQEKKEELKKKLGDKLKDLLGG